VGGEVLPIFDRRRAGALLHLSSLDAALGRGGRSFIDWIAAAGFSVWQVLPLGPTGKAGSPYWVRSDFAGNPAFIDTHEQPSSAGEDYRAFLDDALIDGAVEHGRRWSVRLPADEAREALAGLTSGPLFAALDDFTLTTASLEDVYLTLGGAARDLERT